jgi:hypothetical protein
VGLLLWAPSGRVRVESGACRRGRVPGVDVDGERDVGVPGDAVEVELEEALVVRVPQERHGEHRERADGGAAAHGRTGAAHGAPVRKATMRTVGRVGALDVATATTRPFATCPLTRTVTHARRSPVRSPTPTFVRAW